MDLTGKLSHLKIASLKVHWYGERYHLYKKNPVCVVQIETRFNSTCTTGVFLSLLFTGLLGETLICIMSFGVKTVVPKNRFCL